MKNKRREFIVIAFFSSLIHLFFSVVLFAYGLSVADGGTTSSFKYQLVEFLVAILIFPLSALLFLFDQFTLVQGAGLIFCLLNSMFFGFCFAFLYQIKKRKKSCDN